MSNIFKFLLVILGGMLIGFGTGMIVADSLILEGIQYWLAVIASLILGGFFIALGLQIKQHPKVKKEKKEIIAEETAGEDTEN
jgi:uncharacterized membrane-anchored protein